MTSCPKCGVALAEPHRFCTTCGTPAATPVFPSPYDLQQPSRPASASSHHLAAHGFSQTFGLHPAAALLMVIVNTMIFGAAGVAGLMTLPTGGASLLALTAVSTTCGIILGIITYLAQKAWYDDDKESALIKALIAPFLTAIPVGLPGYLAIPAGIIGLFRRKKDN